DYHCLIWHNNVWVF
nr:immunoglobulin light chain junction region [Macaca mulatta]